MKMENYSIDLLQNYTAQTHVSDSFKVLYVLDGAIRLTLSEDHFILRKGDIVSVQTGVICGAETPESSLVLCVDLDNRLMVQMTEDMIYTILCNTCTDRNRSHHELREILDELVCSKAIQNYKTKSYVISLVYRMIDVLIENYTVSSRKIKTENTDFTDDEKMQMIIRFISENYQDGFSLSDLADELFVSTSTLSRFFHKKTGMYFTDYVNQIRLKYAVNELLYTKKSITVIAMECGFSNPSAFNKVFRKTYDLSPKEYRALHAGSAKQEDSGVIEKIIETALPPEEIVSETRKTAEVDLLNAVPFEKPWQKMINAGNMDSLLYAQMQNQLLTARQELHFTYVRIWSVFSKKMMITDGRTKGVYNFTLPDMIFDFLVSNKLKPYIDFAPRPNVGMHTASELLYFMDDTIVFESREIWEDAFAALIKHLLFRYRKDEINTWIFEFSNTESFTLPYYRDPDYSFFNVYRYGYKTIRRDLEEARIGGFSNPPGNQNFPEPPSAFIDRCRKEECLPDFLSVILFPYTGKDGRIVIDPARNTDMKQLERFNKALDQTGLTGIPVYVSEWNNTISARNYINDSRFRGTYLLRKMSEIRTHADMIGLWMLSDWTSNYYESERILNGASGIITRSGIRKPVYHALRMLNRLNDQLVEIGDNYIVTKGDGDYHVLAYNFVWYNPAYFARAENMTDPKEAASGYSAENPMKLDITLKNLPFNISYTVKGRRISHESGSILDEWEKLNFAKDLSETDLRYLSEICVPHISMFTAKVSDHSLPIHITLKKHEFVLYHIFPDRFYTHE